MTLDAYVAVEDRGGFRLTSETTSTTHYDADGRYEVSIRVIRSFDGSVAREAQFYLVKTTTPNGFNLTGGLLDSN